MQIVAARLLPHWKDPRREEDEGCSFRNGTPKNAMRVLSQLLLPGDVESTVKIVNG